MKKFLTRFIVLFSVGFFLTSTAYAICPVCTIAVGAGVGLSRWLGVDDTISGIWIGGLTISLITWTIDWLDRKKIKFIGRKLLTVILYYAMIVIPLYYNDILYHPLNKLWGIDKLMLGITIGSVFFLSGALWYNAIKAKRGGHAQFPFQKVVMPIAPLVILTVVFYLITR